MNYSNQRLQTKVKFLQLVRRPRVTSIIIVDIPSSEVLVVIFINHFRAAVSFNERKWCTIRNYITFGLHEIGWNTGSSLQSTSILQSRQPWPFTTSLVHPQTDQNHYVVQGKQLAPMQAINKQNFKHIVCCCVICCCVIYCCAIYVLTSGNKAETNCNKSSVRR